MYVALSNCTVMITSCWTLENTIGTFRGPVGVLMSTLSWITWDKHRNEIWGQVHKCTFLLDSTEFVKCEKYRKFPFVGMLFRVWQSPYYTIIVQRKRFSVFLHMMIVIQVFMLKFPYNIVIHTWDSLTYCDHLCSYHSVVHHQIRQFTRRGWWEFRWCCSRWSCCGGLFCKNVNRYETLSLLKLFNKNFFFQ